LDELVEQIRSDRARQSFCVIEEPFSFNVYKKTPRDDQPATDSNNTFLHLELLIDCLLRTKPNLTDKTQLISLCRDIYQGNKTELTILEEFEKTYSSNKALSWYTRDAFVSRLLNKAFQAQKVDLLYLFRFFIHDIQQQLDCNKCSSPVCVYRGQFLSKDDLEIFQNSIGNFISINSFLSTNLTRQKAMKDLTDLDESQRVLFEIEADPRLAGLKSFGSTGQDDEILFMVGSIFRIININHQQDGPSIIRMRLCSDKDSLLQNIFKPLKTEINDGGTDLLLFGDVLWKIGKYPEAEKYYQRILSELPHDNHRAISECYYALGNISMEKNDYNSSFEWHQKSLEIKKRIVTENDPSIADSYNSMGDIERKKGNSNQALEFYNKALDIWTQAYGDDHPKIAMSLNNIGCIYGEEKNFVKTLEYQEKALNIMKKHFSSDHLCLGQAHNNIGSVYRYLGNYELALEHYQIAVKIKLKSFSSKHPSIASTYNNIASVYEEIDFFQQALDYYEKAAAIYRHQFPPTYPDNIRITEDIRRICSKLK
jgi:tetratricopeptide (TPR) repeat protein